MIGAQVAREDRTVSVYALLDEGTRKIRYVGQTMNLPRRLVRHWHDRKNAAHPNPGLAGWLRSLSAAPECLVLEEVPYAQRLKAEEYWTDLLRLIPGVELLNISSGARVSPASLVRMGEATRAKWQSGEYREKQSESRRASWRNPERRARAHVVQTARRATPETRVKMSAAQTARADFYGETSRRMWADPVKREQIREAQRAAWARRRAASTERSAA